MIILFFRLDSSQNRKWNFHLQHSCRTENPDSPNDCRVTHTVLNQNSEKIKIPIPPHLSCKPLLLDHIKRGLKPKDNPYISEIERMMAIFVSRGTAKYRHLEIFKYQYFSEIFWYEPEFSQVFITFIGLNVWQHRILQHFFTHFQGVVKVIPLAFSSEQD